MRAQRRLASLLAGPALAALAACGAEPPPAAAPSPESGGCSAGSVVPGTPSITAATVASGLRSPVDVQSAPGDRRRLFVVEQAGRIRVVRDGTLLSDAFLDITARLSSGGERGLLGLAFHPQYATNGRFFVNYTDRSGETRIAEFRATGNPDLADPATERLVLFQAQPFANHNGGGLAFGPDGFLYIGLGDGGSGGDPQRNAQNLGTLLGKMLRIDVNGAPYGVPPDNPLLARPGARPEIWAYGLRNPWRFSFDPGTGDLYIGDVGQNALEEIDVGLASQRGGENYGWNVMEGSRCFQPPAGCDTSGLTPPVLEYGHSEGRAVVGGVVYRGCRMPGYHGTYFYADQVSGFVRSFRLAGAQVTERRDWTSAVSSSIRSPTAFGTDQDGEMYVADYGGALVRLAPR